MWASIIVAHELRRCHSRAVEGWLSSSGALSSGSLVVVRGLSCSAACGIFLDIEPASLALTGELSTTEPPRKPLCKSDLFSLCFLLRALTYFTGKSFITYMI